jgi:hypothetical protein
MKVVGVRLSVVSTRPNLPLVKWGRRKQKEGGTRVPREQGEKHTFSFPLLRGKREDPVAITMELIEDDEVWRQAA